MENHQQYLTDDKNSRTPKYLVQIYILKLIDYASDGQKNTSVLKDWTTKHHFSKQIIAYTATEAR